MIFQYISIYLKYPRYKKSRPSMLPSCNRNYYQSVSFLRLWLSREATVNPVSLQFHTEQEYWCSYIMFCDKRSCSTSLPIFLFFFSNRNDPPTVNFCNRWLLGIEQEEKKDKLSLSRTVIMNLIITAWEERNEVDEKGGAGNWEWEWRSRGQPEESFPQ